ncbi:ATP-binding protein [Chryseobacterium sp. SL1]|uniref:ATP-binding protein n=1 Tax=Chryseobacterium sp. SL1 TaxID=2995159 RepID=UPI0022725014|nr:ATP-binding protein [Chryseobacterium sp. SL1]MCY1660383.1 ATP-binding protein [Chryseobacterium sp. SL1]
MQFRTKARAVDLLGKGQIADLPTAIIELWKNGYDAYADNLTAEIFQKEYADLENDLFLLTDDGKGMSQSDILDKWLVLGTDSKSRALLEIKPDKETLWKKPRVKAGEKGIGRLSVAFLGNPMLMLTKRIGFPLQLLFLIGAY